MRVLLPKNYETDTDRSYLSYFHDGQNVLYSKESFLAILEDYPTTSVILIFQRMIVVAIDTLMVLAMNEYSAWKYQESNIPGVQFGGKGSRVCGVCHGCG